MFCGGVFNKCLVVSLVNDVLIFYRLTDFLSSSLVSYREGSVEVTATTVDLSLIPFSSYQYFLTVLRDFSFSSLGLFCLPGRLVFDHYVMNLFVSSNCLCSKSTFPDHEPTPAFLR